MGGATSSAESEEEEFHIPPGQEWRHINCTVHARHQPITKSSKEINYCDYCGIVKKKRQTVYYCEACELHFCFIRHRNHLNSGIHHGVTTFEGIHDTIAQLDGTRTGTTNVTGASTAKKRAPKQGIVAHQRQRKLFKKFSMVFDGTSRLGEVLAV